MKPWIEEQLQNEGILHRLLGRKSKDNAVRSLNNLLARATDIESLGPFDIHQINSEYGIDLTRDLEEQRKYLYAQFLTWCLEDDHLSDTEVSVIAALKSFLCLTEDKCAEIQREIAGKRYRSGLERAVADGRLDVSEQAFLKKLESDLRLSDEIKARIYRETVGAAVQQRFDAMVADERVSPDEEAEFNAIAKSLGVKVQHSELTHARLNQLRLYWQIENGEIPVVSISLNLQKNEECYFVAGCQWYETRRVLKQLSYSGPAARIRIAKGLYWKMGSYAVRPQASDEMTLIDTGKFYLTNRRMIFVGAQGNKTIALAKLLDFDLYKDGIELKKETGKNPSLTLSGDMQVLGLLLGRVLKNA